MVEFIEEREPVEEKDIKVVPVNWLEGDAKCMWPKYKSAEKIMKAVLLKQEPNDTFCTHPCQIISRGSKYAMQKVMTSNNFLLLLLIFMTLF